MVNFKPIDHSPLDWLNLFSPVVVLPYLVNRWGQSIRVETFPSLWEKS
jgi:hypothetical protein